MSAMTRIYRPLWEGATYRQSVFLLVGLLYGALWFSLAISMYAVGLSLAIVWIGVPILLLTHRAMRWIARFERWHVRVLLGENLPEIPPLDYGDAMAHPRKRADFGARMRTVFSDGYGWRALAWVSIRVVTGPVGFAWVIASFATLLTLLLFPIALLIPGDAPPAPWTGWTALVWVGPVLAIMVAPVFVWGIRGWAHLHRLLARWALGPCEAELTRAATARAELAEQQVRIDQELHDSIGHMITMNVVQAGAGAHVFDSDPDFARQALRNIEERGRVAMAELDRIIATIRGDDAEPRSPLPELADIEDLAVASRAAGVDVDLRLTDAVVPSPVGRAAYAIVREGVTNAAKHAPGAKVHVHVDVDNGALGITVVNSAPPERARETVPPHSGALGARGGVRHGLAGIRDRVTLLGGRSDIGPTSAGGFEVLALMPLEVAIGEIVAQDVCDCCLWMRLRDRLSA